MSKELPNYLNNSKSHSEKGREQEDKARKHINSGAVWFDQYDLDAKGSDGKEIFLIDVKRAPKTITLSKNKVEKLFRQSALEHKTPAYLIYIGDYVLKCVIERQPHGEDCSG